MESSFGLETCSLLAGARRVKALSTARCTGDGWLKTTTFAWKSPDRRASQDSISGRGIRILLKKGILRGFELRLCLATLVPLVESELLR
jgi:hypothetical protein